MENIEKEVYFGKYCKTCVFYETPEWEDPCDECLAEPSNVNSHKPVKWVENK